MKIKKFYEMFEDGRYDYDKIITILKKSHGWGFGILNKIDEFESNPEYFSEPEDDNYYAEQFHIYLTDLVSGRLRGGINKNHSLRLGKWRLGIPVTSATNIYSKLT